MRGLLEAVTLVRSEADLPVAFERIAHVIATMFGFRVVVTNLRRREWDDFVVVTVHGDADAREKLLGCTYSHSFFAPLLTDRFDREGAYVIPQGSYDWESHDPGERYVPQLGAPQDDEAWHEEDEIFVPFKSSAGELLGVFCVGEPASGMRPTRAELRTLVAVVDQAGVAVEGAQFAVAAAKQRRALEHLLHVSGSLTNITATELPLQLVADAIQDALGFERVFVDLADGSGNLVPHASAGWPADSPLLEHSFPADAFVELFSNEPEIEGCYLVTDEIASRTVASQYHLYTSQRNGRGPDAWCEHWLLVPLFGRDGQLIGVIWPDDPADRLLPSRETLQALRMFANHAATAIETARNIAAIREISTTRARLLAQEREHVARLRDLDTLKDDFVAVVSHELRTPLTSIQGYTEVLMQDVTDAEQRGFLQVIDRNTKRLLDIVNELLMIAELEDGEIAVDLHEHRASELLEETRARSQPSAEAKRITLVFESEPDAVLVADRTRLGQVIDNLVSNALKFTPDGGSVGVTHCTEGEAAVIAVTDTGIGIPADEQAQLFTRFFRTSNARAAHIPGTGLGLAICRAIVQSHGGTLTFDSIEGAGTTFTVRLPGGTQD
jgi:signal transduction histidine kinase